MKISKIKKKLDELFGVELDDTAGSIESMKVLVDMLFQKESKLKGRLEAADDEEDIQAIKQKLVLVKKQLKKAQLHINDLEAGA